MLKSYRIKNYCLSTTNSSKRIGREGNWNGQKRKGNLERSDALMFVRKASSVSRRLFIRCPIGSMGQGVRTKSW